MCRGPEAAARDSSKSANPRRSSIRRGSPTSRWCDPARNNLVEFLSMLGCAGHAPTARDAFLVDFSHPSGRGLPVIVVDALARRTGGTNVPDIDDVGCQNLRKRF